MMLGPGRTCIVLALMVLAACSPPPDAIDIQTSVEQSSATAGPSSTGPAGPPSSAEPDQRGLDGLDQRGLDGLDRGLDGLDWAQLPPFVATVSPIGSALRERMRSSHRSGCPLGWAELRHVRVSFVGFDQEARIGEVVIHRDHARAVVGVFEQLYEARWPIRQMRLVDEYGGDDDRSMAANNTSGYNCRRVAGSDSWSAHAWGAAIDINPVQNPYLTGTSIAPPAGRRFAGIDRSARSTVPVGVIREGDVVVRAFAGIGWAWGGDWSGSKDYQHFSAPGR